MLHVALTIQKRQKELQSLGWTEGIEIHLDIGLDVFTRPNQKA